MTTSTTTINTTTIIDPSTLFRMCPSAVTATVQRWSDACTTTMMTIIMVMMVTTTATTTTAVAARVVVMTLMDVRMVQQQRMRQL